MNEKPLFKAVALAASLALGSAVAAETGKAEDETGKADAATAGQEQKSEANLENGRRLYETCALCHSPQGWGTKDGRYPQISAQHPKVIIKQIKDIRSGNRDNPTMYPFTLNNILPDEQSIRDVAAYIANLPMSPTNSVGPGMDLEHGKMIYRVNCAVCHGKNGEGDNEKAYPRVHGQHYAYLLRQMHWMKMGKRRNGDELMYKQISNLNPRDLDALADYMSRLEPPKDRMADSPSWQNPDFPGDFHSVPMPGMGMPPVPPGPPFQPPQPPADFRQSGGAPQQ